MECGDLTAKDRRYRLPENVHASIYYIEPTMQDFAFHLHSLLRRFADEILEFPVKPMCRKAHPAVNLGEDTGLDWRTGAFVVSLAGISDVSTRVLCMAFVFLLFRLFFFLELFLMFCHGDLPDWLSPC